MAIEATDSANFAPTKRFFVEMLTRDILLEDAILDLLDNCLDGVARAQKKNPNEIDYTGYWSEIEFDKKRFVIRDNCGGIPSSRITYAFRMGKPNDAPPEELATIGVYGIGMKRSIFKMGQHCDIETQHSNTDHFSITIDSEWLLNDFQWEIPIQQGIALGDQGTKITITQLHESVSKSLSNNKFKNDLINKIVFSYSYIINKGFKVKVNGSDIRPNPVHLRYEDKKDINGTAIQPYIYKATIDDVEIKLVVGFYRPLPSESDEENEKITPTYKTQDAGWTIVCNDRIVVYKDKSELTGWGIHFPRYHTQFISITGTLYFTSKYPEKLPITTTKRGIDASSRVFLKAQKHIIEGTKIFIHYTNQWKGEALLQESNERLQDSIQASPLEVIEKFEASENESEWSKVRNQSNEVYYKPNLPSPPSKFLHARRISFKKPESEIMDVGEFLCVDEGATPSQIGEECFDYIHREAKK